MFLKIEYMLLHLLFEPPAPDNLLVCHRKLTKLTVDVTYILLGSVVTLASFLHLCYQDASRNRWGRREIERN